MTEARELGEAAAVFLDRDGTLMEEVNYCGDPANVKVFDGAGDALRSLKACGFKLIIVTNQSGIGRGFFSEAQYHAVHQELLRQLGNDLIDAAYFCGDHPDAQSMRRKPAPGMIIEAQRDHRLNLERSYFVGDKAIDVACGQAAGVRTILVQTGYGKTEATAKPDWIARDLSEAAEVILAHANG